MDGEESLEVPEHEAGRNDDARRHVGLERTDFDPSGFAIEAKSLACIDGQPTEGSAVAAAEEAHNARRFAGGPANTRNGHAVGA